MKCHFSVTNTLYCVFRFSNHHETTTTYYVSKHAFVGNELQANLVSTYALLPVLYSDAVPPAGTIRTISGVSVRYVHSILLCSTAIVKI